MLDETDSGLDIDALRIVAGGVNALRGPERAMIVVTHYQRLLNYIVPDFVHVLAEGRIVKSGGKELALELEAERLRRPRHLDEEEAVGKYDGRSGTDRRLAGRSSPASPRAEPWLQPLRERGVRALRRTGLPDHPQRRVALHQRRADRTDQPSRRATDRASVTRSPELCKKLEPAEAEPHLAPLRRLSTRTLRRAEHRVSRTT